MNRTTLFTFIVILFALQSGAQSLSRVIKQYNYLPYITELYDSISYSYSNSRGDTFYNNDNHYSVFSFDSSTCNYITTTGPGIINEYKTYDSHNNILTDLTTGDSTRNIYSYDADNNLICFIQQRKPDAGFPGNLKNVLLDSFSYDAHGNIIMDLRKIWDNTYNEWDNMQRDFYQYDINNNMQADSTELIYWLTTWTYSYSVIKTYTANLLTSMLNKSVHTGTEATNDNLTRYYYNSSNQLVKDTSFTWVYPSAIMQNESADSLIYTSSGNIAGQYKSTWNDTLNYYIPSENDSFVYDSHHNKLFELDTLLTDTSANNIAVFAATYNSFNQPLTQLFHNMPAYKGGSGTTSDKYNQFVYELYYPTDVVAVNTTMGNITLFPNPAQNSVTVSMELKEAQIFTLSVYDNQGRLYMQYGENATGHYQKSIPVSNLPNGNYILSIRGSKIQDAKPFTVLHP